MNFTPLFDRVLVEREPEMGITPGGIIIPDTSKERPMQGTVISTGFDVTNVTPGDKVLCRKFAGFDIKLNDVDYLIIVEKDILGVVTDE